MVRRVLLPLLLLACLAQTRPGTPPTRPATAPATAPAMDYYALSAEDFFKLPIVQTRITKDSVDFALAEAAVYHQTNLELAKLGKPRLGHSAALQRSAHAHSLEMATMNYFAHESPVAAHRTPTQRLAAVGVRGWAENIHVRQALDLPSGVMTITVDPSGRETRTDSATGKPIDYYTYRDLAEAALTSWMNSPGHRRTILDPSLKYLGTGVARGPMGEDKQDSLYFTQHFAGRVPDPRPAIQPAASSAAPATAPAATTRPAAN